MQEITNYNTRTAKQRKAVTLLEGLTNYNAKLTKQRKSTTVLVGGLLLGGLTLSIPLFNDSIKFQETLYCHNWSLD